MATHDSHAAAETAAETTDAPTIGLTLSQRVAEAAQKLADWTDAGLADHCTPNGDWRPERLTAHEKVWTHPTTDVTVRLESGDPGAPDHPQLRDRFRGWTVTLEDADESETLVENVSRGRAFARAKHEMERHRPSRSVANSGQWTDDE